MTRPCYEVAAIDSTVWSPVHPPSFSSNGSLAPPPPQPPDSSRQQLCSQFDYFAGPLCLPAVGDFNITTRCYHCYRQYGTDPELITDFAELRLLSFDTIVHHFRHRRSEGWFLTLTPLFVREANTSPPSAELSLVTMPNNDDW